MVENTMNFNPPPAAEAAMLQAINNIMSMLEPYPVVLTDVQRKTMAKMADASLPFVEKATSYVGSVCKKTAIF